MSTTNSTQRSKNTPEEVALVARAWAEGKTIQMWSIIEKQWIDRQRIAENIPPSFSDFHYRVKPEPRTFEFWISHGGYIVGNVDSTEDYSKAGWTKIKAKEIV